MCFNRINLTVFLLLMTGVAAFQTGCVGLNWSRACDAGDGYACTHHGVLAVTGKLGRVNVPLGMSRFRQACQLGHAKGCYFAASYYEKGWASGARNLALAAVYHHKACEKNHRPACTKGGAIYYARCVEPSTPEIWCTRADVAVYRAAFAEELAKRRRSIASPADDTPASDDPAHPAAPPPTPDDQSVSPLGN